MPKRTREPGLADGTEGPETPPRAKSTSSNARHGYTPSQSHTVVKTPKTKPAPKVAQNRIKVGVDYGTTNSGVAYVMSLSCDAQDVEVIRDWPNGILNNEQLEKVPSRIAFKSENQGDVFKKDLWGYEVPAGSRSYSWTKLLLDATADKTLFDSSALSGKLINGLLELPEEMTAEEVTTAYLSELYYHTLDVLEKRLTANILKVTPIDFWFTVPATWQESSIDVTRAAAERAGFGSRDGDELSIITEPEAAAIAVLSHAADRNPNLIKVQAGVLICDLGGGTLDFQILTVTRVKPQLETEETIPGIGGKSGSAYIDCNFHTWMETVFGNAFKKLPRDKIGNGSRFMNEWEIVKKSFNGKDLKKKYYISFPALGARLQGVSPSYDTEDHTVIVTGADIASMFEPVFENAFGLIRKLCKVLTDEGKAGFQSMCLCGGLGSSEYVWRRFQQFAKEELQNCSVFADARAWSAVVRGAAIRGLNGSVVLTKKAKRAYGIGIHQAFREDVDKEGDIILCPVKGKRAKGYIYWPIKVGHRFAENMRVKTDLYVTVSDEADEEDLAFKWNLFSCSLENPPDREEHGDVKREGSITLNLSKTYKRSKGDDGNHLGHEAVNVGIVIKMGSEKGILVVEALHGKKVVGTAKIDYARTHARQPISQSAGLLD